MSVNGVLRFGGVNCRRLIYQGIFDSNSKMEAVRFFEAFRFSLVNLSSWGTRGIYTNLIGG